jgi:hypothetical protein
VKKDQKFSKNSLHIQLKAVFLRLWDQTLTYNDEMRDEIMNTISIMDQLQQSGILFNVREESLVSASGVTIPGKKVIINEATNTPLSVVSSRYRTVTNLEIFESFTTALANSEIDMTGATVAVKSSHGGARSIVDMIFPAHEIEIDGDKSQLRISTLNSYDGAWRYVSKAGAIRVACLNGQILGKVAAGYSSLHSPSLDVKKSAEQISQMLVQFSTAKDYWQQMLKRKVTDAESAGVIALFFNCEVDDLEGKPEVNKLKEIYIKYRRLMGNTAFALYNALTEYVTHKTYKPETHAHSLQFHTERLERAVSSSAVFA